jgi:hypothetical protein
MKPQHSLGNVSAACAWISADVDELMTTGFTGEVSLSRMGEGIRVRVI